MRKLYLAIEDKLVLSLKNNKPVGDVVRSLTYLFSGPGIVGKIYLLRMTIRPDTLTYYKLRLLFFSRYFCLLTYYKQRCSSRDSSLGLETRPRRLETQISKSRSRSWDLESLSRSQSCNLESRSRFRSWESESRSRCQSGEITEPPAAKKAKLSLFASYDQRRQDNQPNPLSSSASVSAVTVSTAHVERMVSIASQTSGVKAWELAHAATAAEHYDIIPPLLDKIFCVPASSSPVERVFSYGVVIMRPHRARRGDRTLSALIYLKCNEHIWTTIWNWYLVNLWSFCFHFNRDFKHT